MNDTGVLADTRENSSIASRTQETQGIGARARAQMAAISEPTPIESFPHSSNELSLTVSQANIFHPGDPELSTMAYKLLKNRQESVSKLKVMVDNFKNGTITVDNLLSSFVELVAGNPLYNQSSNSSCVSNALLLEMGQLWKRISELFPEDPYLLTTYENLLKKSKRKGLSVKEFEQMKCIEPRKSVMLTTWNNYKVKIAQENEPEIKQQKTGWDTQSRVSVGSSVGSSSAPGNGRARVLVIDSSKKSSSKSLTSKVGGLKIGNSSTASNSLQRDTNEFPGLPVVQPSSSAWRPENANGAQQQSNGGTMVNKKGKKVLLKFG